MNRSNEDVATHLQAIATRLEEEGANTYRVAAYHDAAGAIRDLDDSVEALGREGGRERLEQIPAVGEAIAGVIEQYLETGTSTTLDGLMAEDPAERELASVSGIGSVLARRIHDELDIETLDELRTAAREGALAEVPGIGPETEKHVLEALEGSTEPRGTRDEPSVEELLDVDREYRRRAESDELKRIAPRRNNPSGDAWLPILHTSRGGRRYTALFSNTKRAHELGTTDDWVVIYEDEPDEGRQWTVITARFGQLEGRRLVRGREQETRAHYAAE